jgi:hypothetical protein
MSDFVIPTLLLMDGLVFAMLAFLPTPLGLTRIPPGGSHFFNICLVDLRSTRQVAACGSRDLFLRCAGPPSWSSSFYHVRPDAPLFICVEADSLPASRCKHS